METVILVIHLLVAIFLVGMILMQRSSGGALDGLGGGSGASSFLSARGTGNFLTKTTAVLATIFFVTSITLSIIHKNGEARVSRSILDVVEPVADTVPAAPSAPVAGE